MTRPKRFAVHKKWYNPNADIPRPHMEYLKIKKKKTTTPLSYSWVDKK